MQWLQFSITKLANGSKTWHSRQGNGSISFDLEPLPVLECHDLEPLLSLDSVIWLHIAECCNVEPLPVFIFSAHLQLNETCIKFSAWFSF
jgi:hypothetical protein